MSADVLYLDDHRESSLLRAHPLADKYTLLEGDEFEQLKEDIQRQGLLCAIWLYQGMILDGRNRYRACIAVGVEPRFSTYEGDAPASFAWSQNGVRRQHQFTAGQRACIALDMLPEIEAEARKRQARAGSAQGEHGIEGGRGHSKPLVLHESQGVTRAPRSVDIAAKEVGCGASEISKAKCVKRRCPDLIEKVRSGELGLSAAYRQMRVEAPIDRPNEWPVNNGRPSNETASQIKALAAQGLDVREIAAQLALSAARISHIAKQHGITIVSKRQRTEAARRYKHAVEQTVLALAGYALGIRTVAIELSQISEAMAKEWIESLDESLHTINGLRKTLRGIHAKE